MLLFTAETCHVHIYLSGCHTTPAGQRPITTVSVCVSHEFFDSAIQIEATELAEAFHAGSEAFESQAESSCSGRGSVLLSNLAG